MLLKGQSQQNSLKGQAGQGSNKKLSNLKLNPTQLVQKQLEGNIIEDLNQKPKIIKFLNLSDYSSNTTTAVPVDEPLFEPNPCIIQFTDYEPLQIKEKTFRLRNKDKVVRRIKILQPDSRLFQVFPAANQNPRSSVKETPSSEKEAGYVGNKIAPGMEAVFTIRFSPEAKIDYNYDLIIVTEREQFIVPIYAIGKRSMIEFPDSLDFGRQCPVKYITEKPVIIRNLGEKTTKWFLRLPTGFDADKKEGVLEVSQNEQVTIKFYPTESKTYKNEVVLCYDNMEAYVPVFGIAQGGDVSLNKSYLQMDGAYIGLQTQQTVKIINKSHVKVDFEWRAFATEKEEQEKKNRLRSQLEEEEAEERMLLKEIVNNEVIHEEMEIDENDDSDQEERDEKVILMKRQKKTELMLARKYKNIRKAIEDDLLLFQDEIFSIEPQTGSIWPNSEMTITVTFSPKGALHYSCIAYCNISCSEERLALNLAGEGKGPRAYLSQSEINLGDRFVNEEVVQEIHIDNQGEIDCKFELLPNERNFGKMFQFDVKKGTLSVGAKTPINITFSSSIPGEFKETFRFRLEGSTELLSILFSGHVIAPTFSFDKEIIDFGKVSYSFPEQKTIKLTNTSDVPFVYNLRIPGDGKLTQKEFEIDPARDVIQKKKSKNIQVTFIPRSTKKYEMVMVVDIEGVGQDMFSLPIKAESEVPVVELKPNDKLEFGEIFLNHPETMGIQLINSSNLKAKFQVLPQNEDSKILATYSVDQDSGIIDPNQTAMITTTLITKTLGEITLPLSINIVGSNNGLPHILNVVASSIGPIVEVGEGMKELDFGQVEVLKDYSKKITIRNKSKIEADFYAFTKNKVSIFKPIQKHGVLKPNETMEVEIICNADDAQKFQDILYFKIDRGVDIDVLLKARGTGHTIFCKEDLNKINFGNKYTFRTEPIEIFVENKSRKPQKLVWAKKKANEKKAKETKDEAPGTSNVNNDSKPKSDKTNQTQNQTTGTPVVNKQDQNQEELEVFSIIPESVLLPPKHGIVFQFRAHSTKKGLIAETFTLTSQVGNERKSNVLYTTQVEGNFIQPTLIFSEKKLYFKYSWEKNVPFMPISKILEITCGSSLPVNFLLKVATPFSISQESFALVPGKSAALRVDFDPGQKVDRVSGLQQGKLQIIHTDHPHREHVELVGEVCFPNIKLDKTLVDFGAILNDTSKKILTDMVNVSEMGLNYEWTFVEEDLIVGHRDDMSQAGSILSRDSKREKQSIPINEVFDILPLSGWLNPGQHEQLEFVYNSFAGQKFKATAVCHVEGGPNYEVQLVGDSSLIQYKLSTSSVELGEIRFCEWVTKEFFIENTGKVTFEYKMLFHQVQKKGFVESYPISGKIAGGEKARVTLRVCPVMPNDFKEIVHVLVGYFEPDPITITGKGYYGAILTNIPRIETKEFRTKLDEEFEKKKLERESQKKRMELMAKAQDNKQKQMPIPQIKSLEQIQMEIEKELDRQTFCTQIKRTLDDKEKEKLLSSGLQERTSKEDLANLQTVNMNMTTQTISKGNQQIETKLYEKIVLNTFSCDFGNVVINSQKKKVFKITNVGQIPIDLSFDQKTARNLGFNIAPERVTKLPPHEEVTLTVTHQAKKNMKFGKSKTIVPIEVKNGARYNLELIANITIPEIMIEKFGEILDFGKVICGQRKTVFVRFVNDKEIACEWSQNMRSDMMQSNDKKKEEIRFGLNPNSGIIPSGQKQIVEITFAPGFEKQYAHKFTLNIKENPKAFIIQVKGQGVSINVEYLPQSIKIGPVLPYENFAHQVLEISNPSDYDTELISLDFDKQYLIEDEIFNQYEEFDTNETLYFPIKNPGDPLWIFVKKSVEKKKRREELERQLKLSQDGAQPLSPEEKETIEKKLRELGQTEQVSSFPKKVEPEDLLHVIVTGQPGCGKTKMIQKLQEEHKRAIINLDQVIDQAIENKTPIGAKISDYLEERQKELENVKVEREKLRKKAGKKAPELDQKWGGLKEEAYLQLTEELIEQCLIEKMNQPECNAGMIFDDLMSVKYCASETLLLKIIMKSVGTSALQMVVLQDQKDEDGLDVWKLVEWDKMESQAEERPMRQSKVGKEEEKKQPKKETKKETKKDTKKEEPPKDKAPAHPTEPPKQPENLPPLFEVFLPKKFETEAEKELYLKKMHDFQNLISGKFADKISFQKFVDPVWEDLKKEEKKPAKKGAKDEEPLAEQQEPEVPLSEICYQGRRVFTTMPVHFNLNHLYKNAPSYIPAPVYPDPNTLPVSDPIFHQIVQRNTKQLNKQKSDITNNILKYFQILTPIENMFAPEPIRIKEEEQLENNPPVPPHEETEPKEEDADKQPPQNLQPPNQGQSPPAREKASKQTERSRGSKLNNTTGDLKGTLSRKNKTEKTENDSAPKEPETKRYNFALEQLSGDRTRWVIPSQRTLLLVVKFFTKHIGDIEGKLEFENLFGSKRYSVEVKGFSEFPQISTLPKNLYFVTKNRRPAALPDSLLSKVYVLSENVFDFGPLLIGKNPENRHKPELVSVNSAKFRISNHGKYPANIAFALMSQVMENNPEYVKNIYFFEPEKMEIGVNDIPKELRVWCIPSEAKKYRDDVIVMIQNNPTPVIIPLQAQGCKPQVNIIEGHPVKFDRFLLKQQAKKEIKLKNTGSIPCKWKITGLENVPEEFSFVNTSGDLKPTQETVVEVNFKAIKQQKFDIKLNLEVEDTEGLDVKQEVKVLQIEAEAFDITIDLKFPENNDDNMLDFGAVRVGDFKDQTFSVKNVGLYKVQFQFAMKKRQTKENFKIEPLQTELEPNQEKAILVRFCSQKEIKMKTQRTTTDIVMQIQEGKTLEVFNEIPINVSVNSVFSKYSILPLKNINFGPIQFNDQKTLTFEIKNEGLFEFNYTIFDFLDENFRRNLVSQQEKEREARNQAVLGQQQAEKDKKGKKEAKQDKKPAKGGKDKGEPAGLLKVGQFAINPSTGSIPPDSSSLVEIVFNGSGQKLFEQKLAIDVSGRDPEDQAKGILYELVGESCIPGINCENFEIIFEEQVIVPTQNQNIANQINSNVFFYEEKCFHFGTLVPSKHPDGICEKFKIMNPNKISCTVKFDVRKRNQQSQEPFAFEIAQKQAKIHPHEHVYVKIFFKPTIMAQYSGIFEAIVESGEQNPKTHKLVFDLRGEGALPTIKLEKPKEYVNESTPILKFPKVRIGKEITLPIVLKNDGQVPATVKWELVTNENFKFMDQNSVTMTPKTYSTFNILFTPKEAGVKQWNIQMQTLLNQYETTKFLVQGEGFYEDIVFEGLPNDLEDEISLGDCVINVEKKVSFQIRNNSKEPVRFTWTTQGCEDFNLLPRNGHLNGLSNKQITLIFKSNKTVHHKQFQLTCETKQIKQLQEFQEWDDSMSTLRYVTPSEYRWYQKRKEEEELRRREEEAAQAGKKKKEAKKAGKKEETVDKPPAPEPGEQATVALEESVAEPNHNVVDKTDKNVNLKVSAVADFVRYEVDVREIFFKPTLMYTSRVHQIRVKNVSQIVMKYSCKIVLYTDNVPLVDPGYFYISPKSGELAPNCDEVFTVRFSPTEVDVNNERFLVFSIENLEKGSEPLVIELNGETERPICHFELQPSSYREKKPDLDPSFNVIEFESLGTKVKNTKRFYVVNPTSQGYEYEWKRIEEGKLPTSANVTNQAFFKCLTQKGVVLSGKKSEMIFEYTPDLVGIHESYWQFEIAEHHIQQNFMLVGTVVEPNVLFDVGKVNFGPLLIGGKNKEIVLLKNLEEVPINFNFEKASILGDPEYADSLSVQPLSGVINSLQNVPIEITFAPKVETPYNYNLCCYIKRKSRPISLNVKGIGYILHHTVFLQNQATSLDPAAQHSINFGDIYINEKRSKTIEIENKGEFNFDFSMKKPSNVSFVQIIPENGTVKQNEKFPIEIKFNPIAETRLTNKHQLVLNITSGPSYIFNLSGSARRPGVELSFMSFDFGPCFVLRQPLSITAYLEMRNKDQSAMSIETNFEKAAYLDVQLPSGQVILPVQTETFKDKKGMVQTKETNVLKIPIIFTPRESKKYEETITFDVNGLHKIDVKIVGEGIPFKLELEKTEDQHVDFGVVRVDKDSTRTVSLINYSKKQLSITFENEDQLAELSKYYIDVIPQGVFTIQPKEKKDIEISFHPKIRLHQFKKELTYKIVENQEKRKLLNILGSCHAVELKLMEDTIGFGPVTINSKKNKSLQLSNLGDIGARYEWDTTFCKRYFSITPLKGFLPPHEDIHFQITFHPDALDPDIRFNKVKCNIEGSDPLFINLLGKCVAQPKEQIQEIKFSTVVRMAQKQKITVKNPTSEICKTKVLINSVTLSVKGYFEGKEFLEIPPNGQVEYEIIYNPFTMTSNAEVPEIKQEFHEGTLFFPLPDGSALLYNLIGQSLPPAPAQTLDIVTKAKQPQIVILPIKNWLKTAQRFQVTWKLEQEDPSIFISGANTFDVTGETTKDYKLSINTLKQVNSKIQVKFRNEKTFEFIHFKINLTVQPPDTMKKIELSSIVRETVTKLITIENPLNQMVEIRKEMLLSDNDNISFNPSSFTIPAHSEFGFEILFRPLLVKEEQAKITLNSVELGQYVYPLQLKGIAPAGIQRNMTFKASLGSDITQTFKFNNYCKKPTVYQCRVEKLGAPKQIIDPKAKAPVAQVDFIVEPASVNAAANDQVEGNEVLVNLKFEPSSLGESQAQLIISSLEGGEYNCLLIGVSSAPQPKGPFKIAGGKAAIDFKNPFFEPAEFIIRIDNPSFTSTVKSPIKIDGKKALSIGLNFKAVPGTTNHGRLIIQIDKSDYPPWVFYLQGE